MSERYVRDANNYWLDAGREPKFFIFDWRLGTFMLLIIFQVFNIWAYVITIVALVFFNYLNYKGYNLANFTRYIGANIAGNMAHGKPFWFKRK